MIMTREQAAEQRARDAGHPVVAPRPPTQAQVDYLVWMAMYDLIQKLNDVETQGEMSVLLGEVQRSFTATHGFVQQTSGERQRSIASMLNELVEEHLTMVFVPEEAF